MPDYDTIVKEITGEIPRETIIRRRYLEKLNEITGRNIVLYYSAFLQKGGIGGLGIDDTDMHSFMSVFKGLDRSKGLDLILHTPGGLIAATEAIIHYLRELFGTDIRVIVPQLAMSAGTLIALSAKEIIMGYHSSLGPIDPQLGGVSAHALIEEFKAAKKEIRKDPSCVELWKTIIAKYRPTFIGDCQKAIRWGEELAKTLLLTGMFKDRTEEDKERIIEKILNGLADHGNSKSHDRHFSSKQCSDFGLKITNLETNEVLQDAVLSLHHAAIYTMGLPAPLKLFENHLGLNHFIAIGGHSPKM
jgi:ATP-dependent protease ClpP protease subunit